MFNKLLIKALKKRFKKLSPEEKQSVRELVNEETKSETTENKKQKTRKRRTKKMADEKEVKIEKEETEKVETQTNDATNPEVETEKVKETEKVEEPKEEETPDKVEEPTAQVEQVEPAGNGVRVEDLVTKDMLAERLSAFEAKYEAVVKENSDLKNQLAEKSDELNGMKDKYENKDFGNFQKQGVAEKDKHANSSFEEYSRAFM